MKWPWQRAERKSELALGVSNALGRFLIFGEGSAATPTSALLLYEQSTAVSIPVNAVAEAFSIVPPSLVVDRKFIPEHPVLDLLRKPSTWFSQELFLDVLAKNYLITGECAVVALGTANQPPQELLPISPKSMTPTRGRTDAPERWHISGNTATGTYEGAEDGREIRYLDGPLRELKVIRAYSTRDNSLLRGQSPLLSASREARSHILSTEHNVEILEQGGRVSLVFHFEEDLDPDQYKETLKRIREQYGGSTKAGVIGVTSGPRMDIKELSKSPKDMDFSGLHKLAQQSVAMVYRVPLPLISADRQTLNNYREAKLALYDDAVLPLMKRIYGGLSDFLFPRFDLDPRRAELTINPDDVTALVSRRNDEMMKRKQIGVETDNELRKILGREPYEGGDIVYKPASMVPAGTDLFTEDNDPALLEETEE